MGKTIIKNFFIIKNGEYINNYIQYKFYKLKKKKKKKINFLIKIKI